MADRPIAPEFTDADDLIDVVPTIGRRAQVVAPSAAPRPAAAEGKRTLFAFLDPYIVAITLMLVAIGGMMVYSTTFDWSFQDFDGNSAAIFFNQFRWMLVGIGVAFVLSLIDYRIWKRFAVPLLLGIIGVLLAVLLFSDLRFGARRAFLNGSYQPSEMAELILIIYMAAWLSAKNARLGSLMRGLLPFFTIVGTMALLVILQPDISAALMIIAVAGVMYFLAGANLWHIGAILGIMVASAVLLAQLGLFPDYAQTRIDDYVQSLSDVREGDWQTRQAIIAFVNGGWTGVGLGNGRQKYGSLPAPHTDSIFATIGEELGVVGATLVIGLYVAYVVRGLRVARRAPDSFGSLLAAGLTLWVAIKALLNIAVMLNLLPQTGAPLPFISYGGSSLVALMCGVGLLLSVARVTAREQSTGKRKTFGGATPTHPDRGWRNGGRGLPSAGNRRGS
jgi:cell division protein FtsW